MQVKRAAPGLNLDIECRCGRIENTQRNEHPYTTMTICLFTPWNKKQTCTPVTSVNSNSQVIHYYCCRKTTPPISLKTDVAISVSPLIQVNWKTVPLSVHSMAFLLILKQVRSQTVLMRTPIRSRFLTSFIKTAIWGLCWKHKILA